MKQINPGKEENPRTAFTANLRNAIGEEEFDGTWAQFKTTIYNVGVDAIGLRNRKHRDWFDEKNLQINKLLED
ncbi:Hypothetical predicted protein [Octopus vulgaris]|uniref:Uncharacterized protein n=1 Tax=Octopus vulgaris TaxID=6645 RepID=A0AA36ALW3_OCTVU|nr:Hypothetical predicted protein [Octopus vulgaris]